MLKVAGWIVSREAAANWMRAHPEFGVAPGQVIQLSFERFVPKRLGIMDGKVRVIIVTWPKVRRMFRSGLSLLTRGP